MSYKIKFKHKFNLKYKIGDNFEIKHGQLAKLVYVILSPEEIHKTITAFNIEPSSALEEYVGKKIPVYIFIIDGSRYAWNSESHMDVLIFNNIWIRL